MKGRAVATAVLALALAPAAEAGTAMVVGAAEDNVRQPSVTASKTQMDLLRLLGLNAVRVTSFWTPDQREPTAGELNVLRNVAGAAKLTGITVYVQVTNPGSRTTPLTEADRTAFASNAAAIARETGLRRFVIGNEPNLNRFWLPQYNPDGSNAASPAYLSLLAATYDALKAVSPAIEVWGGALSPRGEDRPQSTRHTHSPTTFIADMGIAYRASGRSRPVMDGLAIHPYQDNSSQPPSFQHPRTTTISIADYNKLVSLLGLAFDGTAQPASQLPILYAEYGVESQVPPEKSATYTGREPTSTRPVDEATQARYYREALALAFCQPTVRGFFIFHTVDEKDLDRWQSGLYYADSSRKTSFDATRAAVADALGGVVARCPGLQLTPRVVLSSPKAPTTGAGEWSFVLRCTLDCNHVARLERLPGHNTIAERRGKARRGERVSVSFGERRLRPGSYRFTVRATAPVNVGPPGRAASRELRVG